MMEEKDLAHSESTQEALPPMGEGAESAAPKRLTRKEKRALKRAEKRKKRAELAKTVRLFPANKKGYHIMHAMNFLRFVFYPVHMLIYPYRLHGAKKVGKGACIYVGNHYHMFDIFYPARTTREGIHYTPKQILMEQPILGWWLRKVGIGVMRDGSDVRTLMQALRVLKNGEKVALFPEGTRNKEEGDDFLPFRGGAAMLAIKTKTPIVPFVICNRPKVFRMTHVVFGEPFELTEYYDRKLTPADYEEADEKLKNCLYELRAEFRASRASKKKKGVAPAAEQSLLLEGESAPREVSEEEGAETGADRGADS